MPSTRNCIPVIWLLACGGTSPSEETGKHLHSPPAPSHPCYVEPPALTIGTGEFEWQDVLPNDSLVMVHGPQGGWHMLGSVRLQNIKQIVEVYFTITDISSGVVVADNYYRVALIMEDDCNGFYPGMYGYLNVSDLATGDLDTPPELLGGHQLVLHMRATDCSETQNEAGECKRSSRWVESTVAVIAELDPIDQE